MNLLELILKGEWAEIGKENRSVVYKPLFNVSRIVKWLADVRIKLKICHTGSFLDVTLRKKGSTLFMQLVSFYTPRDFQGYRKRPSV